MGTLGRYLQDGRNARGIDLREAAQQTRISLQYLQALEDEDFSKLPGEVFVRGFLKNYGRFLNLNEAEVMKRYGELQQKPIPAVNAVQPEPAAAPAERAKSSKLPIEPFIWAAGIIVVLIVFLFTAFPRHSKETHQAEVVSPAAHDEMASGPAVTVKSDKLYLEIIALENTWLLVRTDTSPQKKAVLNKGESLIWSADERFLLSYSNAGAIKLLLNGQELTVNEPNNAVIRDLVITAAGIENRKIQAEKLPPAKTGKPAGPEQAPQAASSVHAQQSPLSTSPQQSTVRSAVHTAPTGSRQKPAQSTVRGAEHTAPTGTRQKPSQSTMRSEERTAPTETLQKPLQPAAPASVLRPTPMETLQTPMP